MTDFDYKKYSLENLEKWIEDALSSAEASPQEIYDNTNSIGKQCHRLLETCQIVRHNRSPIVLIYLRSHKEHLMSLRSHVQVLRFY